MRKDVCRFRFFFNACDWSDKIILGSHWLNLRVDRALIFDLEVKRGEIEALSDKVDTLVNDFVTLKSFDKNSIQNLSGNDKFLENLSKELEGIKETISSINSDSLNSKEDAAKFISLALDKFPDLPTIGEKFENFEMKTNSLEEKLKSELSLIIEKQSKWSENLETEVQRRVEEQMRLNGYFRDDDGMTDWADSGHKVFLLFLQLVGEPVTIIYYIRTRTGSSIN